MNFETRRFLLQQPDSSKKKVDFLIESKESELVVTERRELKDKNGQVICEIETDFMDGKFHTPKGFENLKIRELKGLRLKRNGKTVDVLGLVDLQEKIEIYVTETYVDASVAPLLKKMVLPPMDTPLRIAIALHELGHAKQHEQPFFKKLYLKSDDEMQKPPISTFYRRVKELMPEWSSTVPTDEILDEMDELQQRLESKDDQRELLIKEHIKMMKQLKDMIDIDEYKKIQEETDRLKSLARKLHDEILIDRRRIYEIIRLYPLRQSYMQKYGERDATKRAFQWMRKITDQIQLDLSLVEDDEPELSDSLKKNCAESVQRSMKTARQLGGTTVKGFLLRMLTTYDALDKMPVPSLKLLEQLEHKPEDIKEAA